MLLANHNLHSVYLCNVDAKMRAASMMRASHIHIDGMPIVLLGRLRGLPFRAEHRVTYADWIHALAELAAENNWRVLLSGLPSGCGGPWSGSFTPAVSWSRNSHHSRIFRRVSRQ